MSRSFETNIAINAVPTASNHVARLVDLGLSPLAGTIDAYGDMLFYLSPAGDDANDALEPSRPGQSLSALLDRIEASDHTLPRTVGVHIFLATGEYQLPSDYVTPILNRPLTISGHYQEVAYAKTVIINAGTWRFYSDRITIKYLTIRESSLRFTRANATLKYVYFEGSTDTAVSFDNSKAFIAACSFIDCATCIGLSDASTLIYRHDAAVMDPTGAINTRFLQSARSVALIYNYDSAIAALDPIVDSFSRITFERPPGFLSKFFTGQVVDGKYVYRQGFSGTITAAAGAVASVILETDVARTLNWGGWWGFSGSRSIMVPSSDISANTWSSLEVSSNTLRFYTCHSSARTNMPYRIWVEYTKV